MLLASEPPQYQLDHTDLDLGLARLGLPLVVSAVNSATAQPGKRPFAHPTLRDDLKPLAPLWATPDSAVNFERTCGAAVQSSADAAVTARSRPSVSATMRRFRPLTRLPPS